MSASSSSSSVPSSETAACGTPASMSAPAMTSARMRLERRALRLPRRITALPLARQSAAASVATYGRLS